MLKVTKDMLAFDIIVHGMNVSSSVLLTLRFKVQTLICDLPLGFTIPIYYSTQSGYFICKTWESECSRITSRHQNQSSWCLGESRIAMDDCIPV